MNDENNLDYETPYAEPKVFMHTFKIGAEEIPFNRLFPNEWAESLGRASPLHALSSMNSKAQAGKYSIPLEIATRLISFTPSLRDTQITYPAGYKQGKPIDDALQARKNFIANMIIFQNNSHYDFIKMVLPKPITNQGIITSILSSINAAIAYAFIHLEKYFKVAGSSLMRPWRNVTHGYIYKIKPRFHRGEEYYELKDSDDPDESISEKRQVGRIRKRDSWGLKIGKALFLVFYGLTVSLPAALIAQPLFLIGNTFNYVQGILDGLLTLLALPFSKKQNKLGIAWTAVKCIARNVLALTPNAVLLVMCFTPLAPLVPVIVSAPIFFNVFGGVGFAMAAQFISGVANSLYNFLAGLITLPRKKNPAPVDIEMDSMQSKRPRSNSPLDPLLTNKDHATPDPLASTDLNTPESDPENNPFVQASSPPKPASPLNNNASRKFDLSYFGRSSLGIFQGLNSEKTPTLSELFDQYVDIGDSCDLPPTMNKAPIKTPTQQNAASKVSDDCFMFFSEDPKENVPLKPFATRSPSFSNGS